jgi:hypothetical protein
MTKLPGSDHLENQACARAAGTGRGRTINHAAIRWSLKPRAERRTYCTSIDRKTRTSRQDRKNFSVLFDRKGATFDPAELSKPLHEGGGPWARDRSDDWAQDFDGRQIGGCARAASGHATALPSSVMNVRRFIRSPRQQWRVVCLEL